MSPAADPCEQSATMLPTYEEALARLLPHAPTLGVERVLLYEALGRVLAQDVTSDRDQPPFNRSAMDGFAVRSAQIAQGSSVGWAIVGDIAAGAPPHVDPKDAQRGVVRIATGAAVPAPFDAVIPIELAQADSTGDGKRVRFTIESIDAWRNVHRRGSDASRGKVVLRAGSILTPAAIGIAATVGAATLEVVQRPRITLLTSGDEVRPPDLPTNELPAHHIRNSNGPMLSALFAALGAPLLRHEHLPDDPEHTLAAAREALSQSHFVVTVGGASVGERDYLRWAWSKLGFKTVLTGARIQPGKPVFATVVDDMQDASRAMGAVAPSPLRDEAPASDNKLVLGLPGNPVSVLATAHLFAWPLLRRMMRFESAALPWRRVTLAEPMQAKASRQLFRAVTLTAEGAARPIPWHGSGDLIHTAAASGFVALPMEDRTLATGESVSMLPLVGSA